HLLLPCACSLCSSRSRHTICLSDWSSDVCSSDLTHELDDHSCVQHADQPFLDGGDGDRWNDQQLSRGALPGSELLKLRTDWHLDSDCFQQHRSERFDEL